ncbi:hypothetical protein GGI24_006026, partial [Coemansia furcata]
MADKLSSQGYNMGAQYYPSCGLITLNSVSGSTKTPTNTVSIPGVYKANDPSLLLKGGISSTKAYAYKVPGPA